MNKLKFLLNLYKLKKLRNIVVLKLQMLVK